MSTNKIPAHRQTVLITGCSPGGIGCALAKTFQRRGFHVFATVRDPTAFDPLTSLGIEPLSLEATSASSISDAVKHVKERTGGTLDYLVNNAGQNYTVPALDISIPEATAVFASNTIAVMALCQAFAPFLIASKGTIVNIGSVAGHIPYVFGSVYNASKAAVHAYSDTLRVELAPFWVRVVVVTAGGVKSRIARTERSIREGSLYKSLEKEYAERLVHSQIEGLDTDVFAEQVVGDVLGEGSWWKSRAKRKIWRGGKANLIWFLLLIMPTSIFDWWFSRLFGLWKLKHQSATKKLE